MNRPDDKKLASLINRLNMAVWNEGLTDIHTNEQDYDQSVFSWAKDTSPEDAIDW